MSNHLQRFLRRLFLRNKTSSFDSEDDEKKRMRTQSAGQLRDLKKRKNLRQKRTDKRRVSAPPEMNSRFMITRRQGVYEVSPDLPIGSKFVSTPPPPKHNLHLKDRDRLLFVSPLIGFAERPVDCEVEKSCSTVDTDLQPTSTVPVKSTVPLEPKEQTSRLRRKGTPHKKKRGKRPASCGDLLDNDGARLPPPEQSPTPHYMNLPLLHNIPQAEYSKQIMETFDQSSMNLGSLADRPSKRRPSNSLDSEPPPNIQNMFRKDFVKGLWSMGEFRLHVNDAGTNTEHSNQYPSSISHAHTDDTDTKTHILFNSIFDQSLSKSSYPHPSPLSSGSTASTDSGRDTDKTGSPSSGQSVSPSGLSGSTLLRENIDTGKPYASLLRKKGKPVPAPRRRSRSQPLLDQDIDDEHDECKSSSQMSLVSVELTNEWKATIAIDIGSAYCGYSAVYHKERGKISRLPTEERIPCCLLLGQDGTFHSFGTQAAEFHHNLDSTTSAQYAYFQNFKANFHSEAFSDKSNVNAQNRSKWPAVTVFAHCLRFFKRKFLEEHSKTGQADLDPKKIRWIISVPSNWSFSSRILLRHTAFQAGLVPSLNPDQVQVISESDAAATFCCNDSKIGISQDERFKNGGSFLTVLCGAENVEITVFKSHLKEGVFYLKELQRTSAGAYGSHGIDIAFKGLLIQMFSNGFISDFINKYPASWHCITKCFESVMRLAHPFHLAPFNLVLPSAFVDFHKKHRGFSVDKAVKKFGSQYIKWTQQEMLCFYPEAIQQLFAPTVFSIIQCVDNVVKQNLKNDGKNRVGKIYVLGGFAHSPMLVHAIRLQFAESVKVEIPLNPGGCISEGSLLSYSGRSCIRIPRARYTYGVSVLHPYDSHHHPKDKCIEKEGDSWCTDVFDRLVCLGQSLNHPKHRVVRSYCPTKGDQDHLVVQVYCSDVLESPKYVTEVGVRRIAVIKLKLGSETNPDDSHQFQLRFDFHGVAGGALTVSAINTANKATIPCELQPLTVNSK